MTFELPATTGQSASGCAKTARLNHGKGVPMSVMNELQNVESRLVARIKELQVMVAELDELRAIA